MFRVQYLPTNACWCATLGDSIVGVSVGAGVEQHLFGTRRELVEALACVALTVDASGAIH